MSELKVIRSIVTYTLHRIENIEKTCVRQTSEEKEISLLPKLPLMELVQLETFEEKLCNEKENQQLFNILRYIGGSRERDCVTRCLEKIFSNYLAHTVPGQERNKISSYHL